MCPRVLVTGHLGPIGRASCTALEAAGFEVAGLDIAAEDYGMGDVTEPIDVALAMRGCSGVVHLAAESSIGRCEADPDEALRVNVGGTRVVANTARELGAWMVAASSCQVYGEPDERHPVSEVAPMRPVNAYGRSKLEAESVVLAAGLRHAILRPSTVYGSLDDHPDRVVPAFVRGALNHSALRVCGYDTALDFVHVSDVAWAVVLACKALEAGRDVPSPMNIATGKATPLPELARICLALVPRGGSLSIAQPRACDVGWFAGDTSKAAAWGFRASVELRDGIAELLEQTRQQLG